ncbi:MAG: hypothetical protein ACRDPJ_20305 [Nocardioidaceae bacterium]
MSAASDRTSSTSGSDTVPRPVADVELDTGTVATRRSASVLAWSLWGLWVALSALTLWLALHRGAPSAGFGLLVVGVVTVGAIVSSRRPRNAVGWLLLALALTFTLGAVGDAYVSTRPHTGYLAVAWVVGWLWYVWLFVIGIFVPLVFPDGHLLSRRWRPVLWLGVAALVACVVGAAFKSGEMEVTGSVQNPLAAPGIAGEAFSALETLGGVLLVVAVLLTATSLVLRFRRSHGVERQQLKWFAFAGMLVVVGLTLAAIDDLLAGAWSVPVGGVGWSMFLFGCVVGIPVATGIAIFRHHLYDIDVVINRTLVYGSLTVMLGATYVGSVLLLELVLNPLTHNSDLAIAASTLAVAALFRPARTRIQAAVDRRFYRRRYDASRTLDDFANRLRHELDLDAVGTDLCAAAEETVQPSHVSLWIRP